MQQDIIPSVEEEQNKEDFNELDENFEVQDPLNNADMNDEQTELEDSTVMIKQEICEDAFEDNEDETDTTEEEEDFEPGKSKKCEPQELVNEDIPLIQIPSMLPREQLQKMFQKYSIPFSKSDQKKATARLETRLLMMLKKQHPLRQHIAKMSTGDLRVLHTQLLGPPIGNLKSQPLKMQSKICTYYFKYHWYAPLTSFLQDKEKLNLKEELEIRKKHQHYKSRTVECIINKQNCSDPSVFVHPEATRSQLLEELKTFGIDISKYGQSSKERLRKNLQSTMKKCHPIHQIIENLGMDEMKGMIWYSGNEMTNTNRSVLKVRNHLANVCFAVQPDSPMSYFTYLQNQYRSIDPEDHKERVRRYRKQIKKKKQEELLSECIQENENSFDPLAD